MHRTPDSSSSPSKSKARGLTTFLLLLNILNFVDRQLVSSLAVQIEEALDLTHAQLGLLYGYAFIVFYTFMGILLGTVADRWNRPRLMAVGLFLWSLLTVASGAAQRLVHMVTARMFVGVGEATLTPSALSMLGDSLPAEKRSRAAGIYYAGSPLGYGASLLAVAALTPIVGWRGCFYILGALGLFLVIPTLFLHDPRRQTTPGPKEAATHLPREGMLSILRLLGLSLVRCPALALAIFGGCIAVFFQNAMNFLVAWMQVERGFTLEQATIRMGLMVIVGGTVGSVLGGVFGDWWESRVSGGRLYFAAAAFLFVAPLGILYLEVDPHTQPWLFYPPLAIVMSISMMMFGPVFAAVQELAPARIRATSVGFCLFCFNVLGTGLGPFVTGWIGDRWSLTRGLQASVVVGLFAVVPFVVAGRWYERDRLRAERL